MTDSNNSTQFFKTACNFEGSLIIVAAVLGWLAGINPFEQLFFSEQAVMVGLLGTVPLFLFFVGMERVKLESILKIRQLLSDTLGTNLYPCHWTDLFFLSAIAGFSEELLFRGLIQPWMENAWGGLIGLLGSNIIFGLVHAVTPLYAVLAMLVGIYLGLSLDYGDERNLLGPMIIHGLYDFLAFLMIMRAYKPKPE
ncbi:CPBP family intramembrane glutamic endopeptidase [Methylicorpusculum sp.]|uniref:CPBP family intramembrane glutamic endopeptidase n=1 Tax=Methylicorpusculum sp. TaxID=2713644 RepID=UPI00271BD74E|nr:CPBP family intramembrane glutamic endopeptidase [Methylicorpusculum sp.]MDO8844983.1 CPBP family intramembrane metalloprotease [Methylicorpusculum sp.]